MIVFDISLPRAAGRTAALAMALMLSACAAIQETTDQAGRSTARSILPEALAVYFPQVPKSLFQPFTNCVVDNAGAAEVQSLAGDAITGVDATTADTIRTILARPSTQDCLRAAAPQAATVL